MMSATPSVASAQDGYRGRDYSQYRDHDHDQDVTRLDSGTVISLRTNQFVDADRSDGRIYTATVDQDVYGTNGQVAIPRGTIVELAVRVAPNNDLVLDIESVVVHGHRYTMSTDPNRIASQTPTDLVGTTLGAAGNGGQVRGRQLRVRRDTLLTFRLERPMEIRTAY